MASTVFPVLETERLLLRETTPMDAKAILALYGDERVTQYYNIPTFSNIAQAEQVVESRRRRFETRQGIRWCLALKDNGQVIGSCGFSNWVREWNKAEIGYELAVESQGQGLMTEAVTAMVDYGFRRMNLNRVEAMILPENEASRRLIKRLDFQYEGLLRQFGFWKGSYRDLELYSQLRADRVVAS